MADIVWRLHLAAPPAAVFELLATDAGRARFWAQRSEQGDGSFDLHFPNGQRLTCPIVESSAPWRFAIGYFEGSRVVFDLAAAAGGGTDLTLTESDVPAGTAADDRAGWVSVLLCLKAAADFGVDLRNHDPGRTWDAGFVDN